MNKNTPQLESTLIAILIQYCSQNGKLEDDLAQKYFNMLELESSKESVIEMFNNPNCKLALLVQKLKNDKVNYKKGYK